MWDTSLIPIKLRLINPFCFHILFLPCYEPSTSFLLNLADMHYLQTSRVKKRKNIKEMQEKG